MPAMDSTQDPTSSAITYSDDWTDRLAAMAGVGITISSVTVTADKGAVVNNVTNTSTSVKWTLNVAGATVTPDGFVTVTIMAVLSNGDADPHHKYIRIRAT